MNKFAFQSQSAFIYFLLAICESVRVKCVYIAALKIGCDSKRTSVGVDVNALAVSHVRGLSTSLGTIKTELGA